MKFALNGALTIGTLDGANVEMSQLIGAEHMFIFGLTAQDVKARMHAGEVNMTSVIQQSERLHGALEAITKGVFSPDDPERYAGLMEGLVHHDRYMLCADFDEYWDAQRRVDQLWQQPDLWWRSAVLNTARTGWFSSDRTIREYAEDIWKAMPDKKGK